MGKAGRHDRGPPWLYIANFADAVWRVTPEGEVTRLTNGLYGSSGNAIDSQGNLLQSNFFANTISKIGRDGSVRTYASEGLSGPVGIAVDEKDDLYVCNCNDNSIAKVTSGGSVVEFASSELFQCPNGITFDDKGNLFVVSFSNEHVVKLTGDGTVSQFATVKGGGGNAHIVFTRGSLYVSKIRTNQVFRVSATGEVSLTAGTGQAGLADGPRPAATLNRPNGIAVDPSGGILYVNNLTGPWGSGERSPLAIRRIKLASLSEVVKGALQKGRIDAAVAAYHRYKKDLTRQSENTELEMNALGFQFLRESNLQAAIKVFELNAASYSQSSGAFNSLAEALKIAGRNEQAIQSYEKALELNPNNANAAAKLKELKR